MLTPAKQKCRFEKDRLGRDKNCDDCKAKFLCLSSPVPKYILGYPMNKVRKVGSTVWDGSKAGIVISHKAEVTNSWWVTHHGGPLKELRLEIYTRYKLADGTYCSACVTQLKSTEEIEQAFKDIEKLRRKGKNGKKTG